MFVGSSFKLMNAAISPKIIFYWKTTTPPKIFFKISKLNIDKYQINKKIEQNLNLFFNLFANNFQVEFSLMINK